jgi:uncharacterized protein
VTTTLKIGRGLSLPVEAVTETFAILAKRGSGKTYTAAVMVEEMLDAQLPVIVIDPVGVWWGLKSSADGTKPGHAVVVFGGDHADVPLEPTAGELLADVIVDERIPAVLDLSGLSKTAARRVVADFAERLYHRNRSVLHVVIDEADAFAPQKTFADGARTLGAIEDLVRRGRARGIGVTLITQRPAVLNKDVLTQAEVLVALRMTGPRDVAAIDEWVRLHADEDQAREVKASLPSLPVGTAWFWSPGWLDVLQRVEVRPRRTYDSSATPKAGEVRRAPKALAEIDLASLGERIAATVERVKATDPAALQRRVAQLEQELAAERTKPAEVERVEVPVLGEDLVVRLVGVLGELRKHEQQAVDVVQDMLDQLHRYTPVAETRRAEPRAAVMREASVAPAAPAAAVREVRRTRPPSDGATLPKAQRAILTVLAQYQSGRSKRQVALLTGYASNGGGFNNAISALRSAGYVEGGQASLVVTGSGLDALGAWEPLPTGRALLDHWKGTLGRAERAILDVLAAEWPASLTKDAVADRTGYAANGGGFNNALSRLRTLELIDGRGELRISDELVVAS